MRFILSKLFKLLSLLLGISLLSFLLVSNSPVDPIQAYIGSETATVSPEQRKNIEKFWGLHESKPTQFLNWTKAIVQGNLGQSLIYRKPVSQVIGERFKASLALMGVAWVFSGILGFILGVIAGMKQDSIWDRIIKSYCFVLASTPAFWLGLVLLMIFSVWLGWFPIGLAGPAGMLTEDITFAERLNHIILPALTLSIVGVANVALHTREKLIDVLNSEFVRYAKAKGESGFKLIQRHGLRNISLPAISLHFASFGELFGGAVLAEQVFSYPGLGQAVVQAGLRGDVPLLLGITLFSALFIYAGNLLADLLYVVIDPRMKNNFSNG